MNLNFNHPGNFQKTIVEFSNSPEYRNLSNFYRKKSFFEALNIQRKEAPHSSFLKWLLDPKEFHSLESVPLQKLLEVCALVISETNQKIPVHLIPDHFFDDVISGNCDFFRTHLGIEKSIGPSGRIDIFIESNIRLQGQDKTLFIIIENKIDSKEHDRQTIKYHDWVVRNVSSGDLVLMLYLTSLNSINLTERDLPECECKDFVQINYQYLLDYLIEPALELTPSDRARMLISDYIMALTITAITKENDDTKGDLIMAISEQERTLLKAFWNRHKDIILAAFYAISSDPEQEKETRDQADKVIQYFSNGVKDYGRYAVRLDGNTKKSDIVKTNIGREVAAIVIEEGLSRDEFELIKADKSSGFELLKQDHEITEGEKKYNRYRLLKQDPVVFEGQSYYASGNWGENNISKFQAFLDKNFPLIKLIKQDVGEEGNATN